MTDAAKEARREYYRKWNREHPDKKKEYDAKHWEKVAAAEKAEPVSQ